MNSITDNPPNGLAVWSTKTKYLVRHAVVEAGVSMSDVHLYGAYLHVSRGNLTPSKEDMLNAFNEAPDSLVDEMEAYINRVTDREAAADVEVESAPGKRES